MKPVYVLAILIGLFVGTTVSLSKHQQDTISALRQELALQRAPVLIPQYIYACPFPPPGRRI